MTSYTDVFGITFSHDDGNVEVGDIVVTGESNTPQYKVIAIVDQRAWIRHTNLQTDYVVELSRCRKAVMTYRSYAVQQGMPTTHTDFEHLRFALADLEQSKADPTIIEAYVVELPSHTEVIRWKRDEDT